MRYQAGAWQRGQKSAPVCEGLFSFPEFLICFFFPFASKAGLRVANGLHSSART